MKMKRILLCLVSVAVVFVLASSVAVADCPDTTYRCKIGHYRGNDCGSVTLGNCTYWHWDGPGCEICGKDKGKPARICNEKHPKHCTGLCVACPEGGDRCWDVNGHELP